MDDAPDAPTATAVRSTPTAADANGRAAISPDVLSAVAGDGPSTLRTRQAYEEEARHRWQKGAAQLRQKAWSSPKLGSFAPINTRPAKHCQGEQPDRPRDQQAAPPSDPPGA